MNTFSDELSKYSQMNEVSTTNGVVFFGSSYFANMPVSELARDYELEEKVYNRSLYGMTISDVDSALEDCIFSLSPKKIFVNIGEEDIKSQSFNEKEFLTKYEWMLYTIHDKTDAQIYLVSIISRSPEAAKINKLLKKLAKELTAEYGKGYTKTNLYHFYSFYKTYPEIFHSASGKLLLSWTHYRTLLQVNDKDARDWYEKEALEQTWSVATLQRNISSQYYYRMLQTQRQDLVENEMKELTAGYQNDKYEFIKSPVIAEFLGFAQNTDFTESDLEKLNCHC